MFCRKIRHRAPQRRVMSDYDRAMRHGASPVQQDAVMATAARQEYPR